MPFSEKNAQKFGALTIIDYIPRTSKKERLKVKCLCDCGNVTKATTEHLRVGDAKSCGCLRYDIASDKANRLVG